MFTHILMAGFGAVIGALIAALIIYFLGSFVNLSFDITLWTDSSRDIFAFMCGLSALVGAIVGLITSV